MRVQKGCSPRSELGPQYGWIIRKEANKVGDAVWVRGGAILGHTIVVAVTLKKLSLHINIKINLPCLVQ